MSFLSYCNKEVINESIEGIIYKATCKTTGKCYIGQTIFTLDERIKNHFNISKKYRSYFHNSLHKNGLDNFIWEIIDVFHTKNEANILEAQNIIKYNTKFPKGYNLTNGGDGCIGYKHTKETKQKISELNKGKKAPFLIERNKSEKMRAIVSAYNKGKVVTDETKKKMSEKKKLLVGDKHPQFGCKHTLERRMKNSISHKGLIGNKNGMFNKRKFKNNIVDILKMRNDGNTFQQIMDELNVSYYAVKKITRGEY